MVILYNITCLIETLDIKNFVTSSFLALILKRDIPQSLEDYRPICLIDGLLKIISKLLASKLRRVIGKLVSTNHTAFIPGR